MKNISYDQNISTEKKSVDKEAWTDVAEQLFEQMEIIKHHQKLAQEYKEKLIELSYGKSYATPDYALIKSVRKGSVDYKKVKELQGVDLEPYRKEGCEIWSFKNLWVIDENFGN